MAKHFVGIDVGTGSARAGIFDERGSLLAQAKRPIAMFRGTGSIVEQSSTDIWRAVCECVREAVENTGLKASDIAGISFDATCSLVVLGEGGAPLTVSRSGDPERNIIVWMDHRATDQALRINSSGAGVLDYVGGIISPEMETPKLLWLAENMPATFDGAWQFMDLTDFLTWKASGSLARSVCTVTCKWTYLAHENRWDENYFSQIGLSRLADEGFARIGTQIVPAGTALGQGLTPEAAQDLGLPTGTPVGAGLIDAHAGGIGTVGQRGGAGAVTTRMAYVFGTSACTLSSTENPAFVPGVWGPYFSAMVPGLWLNEAGQSAAGAAIDHLVQLHPYAPDAGRRAAAEGKTLSYWLSLEAAQRGGAAKADLLAGGRHVVPEFLGNRAPFADPEARGLIAGIGLDTDLEGLVGLYVAGVCGLGYGLRQITQALAAQGVKTDLIVVSGGAGQSPLVRQLLADATNIQVAAAETPEPVLLGSAILAAVAAGRYADIPEAMAAMSVTGDIHEPNSHLAKWHAGRYGAFRPSDLIAVQKRQWSEQRRYGISFPKAHRTVSQRRGCNEPCAWDRGGRDNPG